MRKDSTRDEEDFPPSVRVSTTARDRETDLQRLMEDLKTLQVELLEQNRELRDAQREIELSRDRYAQLYDRAPVGYCSLDRAGTIREINLAGASMIGVERSRLIGSPLGRFLDAGQNRPLQSHIHAVLSSGGHQTLDVRLSSGPEKQRLDLRLDSEPTRDEENRPLCLTVMHDVTEQLRLIAELREREQDLSRLALHDPLTGLPNRTLFADRVGQAIAHAQRNDQRLGVLFIDLDRFKLINDTLGHPVGDAILKAVADRLTEQVRQIDTVARIGGDEFLMLVAPIGVADAAAMVAQKLLDVLQRPYPGPNGEIALTASIGISIYPEDGQSVEDLVRTADSAMYTAKHSGRNAFRFYTEEMTDPALDRILLKSSLNLALERGELVLHYQPQLALGSRRILGIEALVRWNHPLFGCLPPQRFLPLAEETGLIRSIDSWVLRTACAQRKQWQTEGLDGEARVKINLSKGALRPPDLAREVKAILQEQDLSPRLLCLELAETAPAGDTDAAAQTLCRLRALGVELSIDHFGLVSSELRDLKRLKISELKIDRSLIEDLPENGDDAAIMRAMLAFGQALGLRVAAQGVETQDQVDFLKDAGYTSAQGYFYAAPLSADDLIQFVRAWT